MTKPDFFDVVVNRKTGPNRAFDYEISVDFKYLDDRGYDVKDLVIKGGAFYAMWNGERWSMSKTDVVRVVDFYILQKVRELRNQEPDARISSTPMSSDRSGLMRRFSTFAKEGIESDQVFNSKILFANHKTVREDYSTFKLPYVPNDEPTPAFDKMMDTLYTQDELDKILWCLGALFTGDIVDIEKFLYLYGPAGTGKGSILKIISMLIGEYKGTIDLKRLTGTSEFATGDLKELPLLIDSDTDISKIKNDTNLLKVTSHEEVLVNKKGLIPFPLTFRGLIIAASNQRAQFRDSTAGISRRLLSVTPTGKKIEGHEFENLMNKIEFELPGIAHKALTCFNEKGKHYYDNTVDIGMMEYGDIIFNFVREHYRLMMSNPTLAEVELLYKAELEDRGWETKGYKERLRLGLERFFDKYVKDSKDEDGNRKRHWFKGFRYDMAFPDEVKQTTPKNNIPVIDLSVSEPGIFEDLAKDYPAQYTNDDGNPRYKWDNVRTTLKDLDPTKLHFVRVPQNHIIIDFDCKNDAGEKDLAKNLELASKYPETYTEVSKSGGGVHLHYWYDGDVSELANRVSDDVEIKVYSGNASLRRMMIKSNGKPVTHISSGLPLKKKERNMNEMYKDVEHIQWTEAKLNKFIDACLNKEHHGATKPEIDFIYKVLEDAQLAGTKYDVRGKQRAILSFAMSSTNQSSACMDVVSKMVFCTIDEPEDISPVGSGMVDDKDIYFYDVEIFPNLFLICYKKNGFELPEFVLQDMIRLWKDHKTEWINHVTDPWYIANLDKWGIMFNPTPEEISQLLQKPLGGFNNLKYDNHVVYGRLQGKTNLESFQQSSGIIDNKKDANIYTANEISYCDVYEFMDIKQSLKAWEIELGLKHDEFEHPWDQPLDEELWARCAEYCMNDVDATDKVFNSSKGQAAWNARKILATLNNITPNTKTQTQAEKFLFGDEKRPQDQFNWYDLSSEFPGYEFSYGKSTYLGENPSEGGYVYSEPGVYEGEIYLFDVASLHPSSLIAMNYFGPYTDKFAALVQCRLDIKHKKFEDAIHRFDTIDPELSEKLRPYLEDPDLAGNLAHALKIIINTVYGMTSAPWNNKFKDPRNLDNVVAKRGALFMLMLKHEVQGMGGRVVHIKTDSIKVVNPTQEIIDHINKRGQDFGYTFEHEHTFDKFILIDKANLAGRIIYPEYQKGEWETIGAVLSEPYVKKTLFTGEDIVETDLMMLKSVKGSSIHLDDKFIGRAANVYASISGHEMTKTNEVNISAKVQTRWKKPLPKKILAEVGESNFIGQEQVKAERIAKEINMTPEEVTDIVYDGFKPRTRIENVSVTGTKGYFWRLASDYQGIQDVDMGYYKKQREKALDKIYKVGDGNIVFAGTDFAR